jgi:hypothetical protein
MKYALIGFISAVLLGLPALGQQPVVPSPFGFSPTMTKADVVKLLGTPARIEKGGSLMFETSPQPNSLFKWYEVLVPMGYHVLKVGASTGSFDTSRFGTELKEKYERIKTALVAKYGAPETDLDSLRSGSLWTEPEDFMMGLLKKERYLAATWNMQSGTGIIIEADAEADDAGTIIVIYALPGCKEYEARRHAAEDAHSF